MATRVYYQLLSALIITNRLFPAVTENVLGEKYDDEFDFDGLPGVQHEFKIEVPAGREECFFQFLPAGGHLYLTFEVIRGGDRKINYFLVSGPDMVDSHYDVTDGKTQTSTSEQTYYHVCFDNTQSRFSSKLVYFQLITIILEGWSKYMIEVAEIKDLAVNLSAILTGVEISLIDLEQYQTHTRLNVIRDWYLIKGNNVYIGYWSTAQCVVVVLAGVCQVVFLRRLFSVPKVTPTSKPRA